MKTPLLCALSFLAVILAGSAPSVHGQGSVPADLEITASAGGRAPWAEIATVRIDASGQGSYKRYVAGAVGAPFLEQSSFTLTSAQLQQVWQAIQDNNFFSLDGAYSNPEISDGAFARVAVQANENTHAVRVQNTAVQAISGIISALNGITPAGKDLDYEPPERFTIVPRAVCGGESDKAGQHLDLRSLKLKEHSRSWRPLLSARAAANDGESAHPGTVVAYRMSLQEAADRGIASLESKGGIYGDEVTIKVNNEPGYSSDDLVAKLYLEFWGPNATPENGQRIKNAIESAWSGKQTSDGKTLTVEVETRLSPGGTSAPQTPGYHQIRLVGEFRSEVEGFKSDFDVNRGVGKGTWETIGDGLDAIYAHEAGHLLGIDDRYDNWEKQPDGTWVRNEGELTFTSEQLAEVLQGQHPDQTVDQLKAWLEQMDAGEMITKPWPSFEDDLMADLDGTVQQQDIDHLAGQAGLLVEVRPGDIFLNKNVEEQNYAVTRSEDVFVEPGQTKTLLGVYVACIDLHKGVPDSTQVFDVAPPLSTWQGIEAAALLLNLVRYIDTQERFCEYDGFGQLAVWRITDNDGYDFPSVNELLQQAGIDVGDRLLDFPRISNPHADSPETRLLLPFELLVADISPRTVLTTVGATVTLNGSLFFPSYEGLSVSSSWFLQAPAGSQAVLSDPQDGAVSFTADRRGIYRAGFNVTMSGYSTGDTTIAKPGASITAADEQADTFERGGLQGPGFPWETGGDAPWTITDTHPHSGSFSAESGDIGDDQASTLEITFSLPEAGDISFAYRVSSEEGFDYLTFFIDGVAQDSASGEVDWRTAVYTLGPGHHTLTWTYRKDFGIGEGSDRAWIDDVFFPSTAVGIAVHSAPEVPTAYSLEQNYPNPFNFSTTIRYALPVAQHVTLKVYDGLGREVATLVNARKAAARHEAVFDGSGLSSGVYFYRLEAGDFTASGKMLLLK